MEALAQQDTELLIRGIIGLITGVTLLFGSVWLLLSLILGVRLGYLIMASTLFGILIILSLIWLVTAFGPAGPETTWVATGAGEELSVVEREEESWDVSDYPAGDWVTPAEDLFLAEEDIDTESEEALVRPVLNTVISEAVNPKRAEDVEHLVESDIELEAGAFEITDIKMQDAIVDGKESIIAVSRAVPSARVRAGSLGDTEEGLVKEYLKRPGEEIAEGEPFLVVSTDSGEFTLDADVGGRVLSFGLREPDPERNFAGDVVREGIPIAVVDISGPGQPDPVEVAAVRVRGSVRTPSAIYMIVSIALFVLHLAMLNRYEKTRAEAQPAPA